MTGCEHLKQKGNISALPDVKIYYKNTIMKCGAGTVTNPT